MSQPADPLSLHELVGQLIRDITALLRKEIELAKAEAWEKVNGISRAAALVLAGAAAAVGAVGVLLAALVSSLAVVFVLVGMESNTAASLAAAVVAITFGLIAWALIAAGIASARRAAGQFDRTVGSLASDATLAKETLDGQR